LLVTDSYEDLSDSYDLGDDTCPGANPLTRQKNPANGENLGFPKDPLVRIYPKNLQYQTAQTQMMRLAICLGVMPVSRLQW
jgi:hypothetical protein